MSKKTQTFELVSARYEYQDCDECHNSAYFVYTVRRTDLETPCEFTMFYWGPGERVHGLNREAEEFVQALIDADPPPTLEEVLDRYYRGLLT